MNEVPKSCRILIVEDESIVAMDLEDTLERLGYTVIASTPSGEQAMTIASWSKPDLVLMDIQLRGEMDGITTAEKLGRDHGIPIVFLTANANQETIARAKDSGSYGFLHKPFRARELNATIEIALHQHQASRQLFAERSWLRTVLGSISDGVIATDLDGIVRFLNPSAAEITGWPLAEAMGKPIEQVYHLRDMQGGTVEHCQIRRALRDRAAVDKERFLLSSREGAVVPIEDAAAPILENGEVLGAVTIFLDISEKLAREQKSKEERQRLTHEVQKTSEALGQTREELQALARHLITAQEEERRRIARELHDDLGQQAALLGMKATALESEPMVDTRARATALRTGLDTLAQGLREASHRLHPGTLADLGLRPALESLVLDYRTQGQKIDMDLTSVGDLPIELATALYRIVQESLRNVQKHSPEATTSVLLCATEDEVLLRISDDGRGFYMRDAAKRGGLGLISMHERARLIGGVLRLTSAPGSGTSVLVRAPRPN